MKTKVEAEGPLVLPKAFLDGLGIKPGAILDIDIENGSLIARRESPADAIRAMRGSIDLGMSTDEYMAFIRERE